MKDYDELLTLGEYLTDEERHNLYQFLLESKIHEYSKRFAELNKYGTFTERIANCEIKFELVNGSITNFVRKVGSENFESGHRNIRIWSPLHFPRNRAARFFAQCEVDAIRNFPLPGLNKQTHFDFGINHFPYYDLNYYSNGRGRVRGFFAKLKAN